MPTANIYYTDASQKDALLGLTKELKEIIARELTCADITLSPDEISIRMLPVEGDGMIGDLELEISAHAFPERVAKQDAICINIAKYLSHQDNVLGEVRVWLALSELGHSWE